MRAHLGHHESVRDEEQDDEDDGPRQRLKAVRGRLSDQVQPDDDRDGEEHHVEAAQRLDQMLLLLDCEGSLLGVLSAAVVTKPSFMVARPDARGTGSAVAAPAYLLGYRMQRSKCPKALVTRAAVANPTRSSRAPRSYRAAASLSKFALAHGTHTSRPRVCLAAP